MNDIDTITIAGHVGCEWRCLVGPSLEAAEHGKDGKPREDIAKHASQHERVGVVLSIVDYGVGHTRADGEDQRPDAQLGHHFLDIIAGKHIIAQQKQHEIGHRTVEVP